MNTTTEQLNYYFSRLNEAEQNSVLHLLATITKSKAEPSERISIDHYNMELEEALAEAERGKVLSHNEVEALSKEW